MTLLASHLPVLYCLLHYRNGRFVEDTTRGLKGYFATSERESSLNHNEGLATDHHSKDTQPWSYHHRSRDISDLCKDLMRPQTPRGVRHQCSIHSPRDIRRLLPGFFVSERDMSDLIKPFSVRFPEPQQESWTKETFRNGGRDYSRYTFGPTNKADLKHDNLDISLCGNCQTSLGYEVIKEVTDTQGQQHSVINFVDGYQFIAAGRCVNPGSPCGVEDTNGHRRQCVQIYRAHWTLVWTAVQGARLIPHEVPSHCACLNVGQGQRDGGNATTMLRAKHSRSVPQT